jgi:putative ABC transport system ATP-binding protein
MSDILLSAQELQFSYTPERPLLSIPTFTVHKAEKVFLYGPSGSGKSTFLNLAAGVLRPTGGSLKLFGNETKELSLRQLDRIRGSRLGYVFQNFNLIPYLSILDNVLLPTRLFAKGQSKTAHKERAITYLERLNLASQAHDPAEKLSIGQQQRVAIARAFMSSPELLIADEPTSSLDEDNTESFMELLVQEVSEQKMGLLFVSHDRRLERFFDRGVNLNELNR